MRIVVSSALRVCPIRIGHHPSFVLIAARADERRLARRLPTSSMRAVSRRWIWFRTPLRFGRMLSSRHCSVVARSRGPFASWRHRRQWCSRRSHLLHWRRYRSRGRGENALLSPVSVSVLCRAVIVEPSTGCDWPAPHVVVAHAMSPVRQEQQAEATAHY